MEFTLRNLKNNNNKWFLTLLHDDKNIRDSCLRYAVKNELEEFVVFLMESDADLDYVVPGEGSMLDIACRTGNRNIVKLLTDCGASKKLCSNFANEVQNTLKHAIDSNYTIDNAVLELKALKFAYNASNDDCIQAIVPIILARIQPNDAGSSIRQSVATWMRVLHEFVNSRGNELTVLHAFSSFLSSSSLLSAFVYLLPLAYKLDIISDDAIVEWYNLSDSDVKPSASDFVRWITERD